MIKHIVIWRVKDRQNEQTQDETARAIKAKLEGLRGRIPGLLHIEAGTDFCRSETAYDVALYSEFESRSALDGYQIHPEHQEVTSYIRERCSDRVIVDYEV